MIRVEAGTEQAGAHELEAPPGPPGRYVGAKVAGSAAFSGSGQRLGCRGGSPETVEATSARASSRCPLAGPRLVKLPDVLQLAGTRMGEEPSQARCESLAPHAAGSDEKSHKHVSDEEKQIHKTTSKATCPQVSQNPTPPFLMEIVTRSGELDSTNGGHHLFFHEGEPKGEPKGIP